MEDAHIALPSLGRFIAADSDFESQSPQARGWDATALFGVMDGHGGVQVARFCERHLPGAVARGRAEDAGGALAAAFLRMDELLWDARTLVELQELSDPRDRGKIGLGGWAAHPFVVGCTALVCCVRPDAVVVANAGDCRAVLSRAGKALELSEDHKPDLPRESARIQRAGGWVEAEQHGRSAVHRVNGDLSLSRAIGDLEYKQNKLLPPGDQLIVATPDVMSVKRERSDEFLLIACDGVWDVISSQEAVDFVRARLGRREDWARRLGNGTLNLSAVTEELLDRCLSPDLEQTDGIGGDNMTAVLVLFLPSPSESAPQVPLQGIVAGVPPLLVTTSFQPPAQRLRPVFCG